VIRRGGSAWKPSSPLSRFGNSPWKILDAAIEVIGSRAVGGGEMTEKDADRLLDYVRHSLRELCSGSRKRSAFRTSWMQSRRRLDV
jgi:hypothetical protein